MSRLFFILAIAATAYLLFRSFRKNLPGDNENGKGEPAAQDMVRCAQCGVYIPKAESVQADENFFCCAAHRDTFRK